MVKKIKPIPYDENSKLDSSEILQNQTVDLVPIKEYSIHPKLGHGTSSTQIINTAETSFQGSPLSKISERTKPNEILTPDRILDSPKRSPAREKKEDDGHESDIDTTDSSESSTGSSSSSDDSFIAPEDDDNDASEKEPLVVPRKTRSQPNRYSKQTTNVLKNLGLNISSDESEFTQSRSNLLSSPAKNTRSQSPAKKKQKLDFSSIFGKSSPPKINRNKQSRSLNDKEKIGNQSKAICSPRSKKVSPRTSKPPVKSSAKTTPEIGELAEPSSGSSKDNKRSIFCDANSNSSDITKKNIGNNSNVQSASPSEENQMLQLFGSESSSESRNRPMKLSVVSKNQSEKLKQFFGSESSSSVSKNEQMKDQLESGSSSETDILQKTKHLNSNNCLENQKNHIEQLFGSESSSETKDEQKNWKSTEPQISSKNHNKKLKQLFGSENRSDPSANAIQSSNSSVPGALLDTEEEKKLKPSPSHSPLEGTDGSVVEKSSTEVKQSVSHQLSPSHDPQSTQQFTQKKLKRIRPSLSNILALEHPPLISPIKNTCSPKKMYNSKSVHIDNLPRQQKNSEVSTTFTNIVTYSEKSDSGMVIPPISTLSSTEVTDNLPHQLNRRLSPNIYTKIKRRSLSDEKNRLSASNSSNMIQYSYEESSEKSIEILKTASTLKDTATSPIGSKRTVVSHDHAIRKKYAPTPTLDGAKRKILNTPDIDPVMKRRRIDVRKAVGAPSTASSEPRTTISSSLIGTLQQPNSASSSDTQSFQTTPFNEIRKNFKIVRATLKMRKKKKTKLSNS